MAWLSARDLKLAVRTLWRRPGFTLVAVVALAVGFGTNTAIFSIVNTLLLRPLPYPDGDRLVSISGKSRIAFEGQLFTSPVEFVQWHEANRAFSSLVACSTENATLALSDQAEEVKTVSVSGDLFPMLQVHPQLGQSLVDEDFRQGTATRVLISDRLWRTLFAADPQIVGRPLLLNDEQIAIAGVMPAGFEFPSADADMWRPLRFTAAQLGIRGKRSLDVYGSLKPGMTPEQGSRDLVDIVRRMERDYPDWLKGRTVEVTPLHEKLTANIRPTLLMLLGIVTLVLVIACANVSHLLLARMVQRRREMALRTALGGSPAQIVRQVFLECLVLALTSAALGLLLAPLTLRALALLLQSEGWSAATTAAAHAGLDWRLLLYTVAIAIGAVFLFGLGPAISAARVNLSDAFQDGSQQASESSRTRFARTLLIVGEVALTVVVLAGAGLLIRSFVELQQVRRGYDAHNLLTLRIPPPRRKDLTPQQRAVFINSLLREVRALPGARSAAVVTGLPLGGLNASVTINVEGYTYQGVDDMPWADISTISDGYFKTMGTRLVRGRGFEPTDTTTSLPVAIVNQAFVRQYWPTGDPIGKQLGPGRSSLTVVGVVEDLRQESLQAEQSPTMYVPYTQRETLAATANFLVVRTSTDPTTLSESITQVIRRLDSGQVIRDVRTMEQVVARSVSQQRALMSLMAVFGTIALLLACAGVYSANQYAVVQRTRELGIRLSLGARRTEILALVVRQGMVPVWIGIAIGLTAALLSSRAVSKLLYGISPLDPMTFALVATTAVVVSLIALTLPAWRATTINPIVALRHD
jgi:putative ABC transport system permease protein